MATPEELQKGKAIAKQIKEELSKGDSMNEEAVLDKAYELFFDTIESNNSYSYITGARLLTEAGVMNKCGEQDSFGPLSWGILVPGKNPNSEASWLWFG